MEGTAQPGETLLEAGLAVGAPMTFSCTLGGCGRCRVKLVSGEVETPEPNCLLPQEREANYALSCIARPLGTVVFESPSGRVMPDRLSVVRCITKRLKLDFQK